MVNWLLIENLSYERVAIPIRAPGLAGRFEIVRGRICFIRSKAVEKTVAVGPWRGKSRAIICGQTGANPSNTDTSPCGREGVSSVGEDSNVRVGLRLEHRPPDKATVEAKRQTVIQDPHANCRFELARVASSCRASTSLTSGCTSLLPMLRIDSHAAHSRDLVS